MNFNMVYIDFDFDVIYAKKFHRIDPWGKYQA